MMSDIIASEFTNTHNAIDSKIMDFLNPIMHHHDLLQSYVRALAENISNSKQSEEESDSNFSKISSSLELYPNTESTDDKQNYINNDRKKKKKDKKQQKGNKFNKLSIESEMNIQKKKK